MAGYNRVIMMGNLTRDPQLSYLASQTPVTEFGLATSRKWKSQGGDEREDICFIDCRVYGNLAETISKHFQKGRSILVEGNLTFDQWETPEGQKRSKHRILVERFTFINDGQKHTPKKADPEQRPADEFMPDADDDSLIPF